MGASLRLHGLSSIVLLTAVSIGAAALCSRAAVAQDAAAACEKSAAISLLAMPLAPWSGAALRVLATSEKPLDGALTLTGPDGSAAAQSTTRQGGPPYFWIAEVATPAAGTWHVTLSLEGAASGCATIARDISVASAPPPPPKTAAGSVWPISRDWNRATENLYSAWIQKLFDGPLDADLSWPTLTQVLRDRSRNLLINYLGAGEDEGILYHPDCAKMPYFLRAYFAFKLGLPFGFSHCWRGDQGSPPHCVSFTSILRPGAGGGENLAAAYKRFLPLVTNGIQSGNGRTSAADDRTDFYPVPLKQETLRPGTIYADPYGHVLMLVRRVPQTATSAGVFLAADAEPDGTVTRKRFWRGNFLFVHNPRLGSPGFKRFRPIMREANGSLLPLTNREIADDPQYGDFALEQSNLGTEDFYDRMDEVMSPEPLDPVRAMRDAITSLDEQAKTRVVAVENGRKYQTSGHGDAAMPSGASIFQAAGAWEDFATPSRDFRMLIAIDVVRGFPDRVARHPDRYAMPAGKSPDDVKADLERVLDQELSSRKITYTRSDGSNWTISLKDVVDRAAALEMGYNLNDCVELRWGAPDSSAEASTCKRHAPQTQRAKMEEYRTWFRDRHWPTRA